MHAPFHRSPLVSTALLGLCLALTGPAAADTLPRAFANAGSFGNPGVTLVSADGTAVLATDDIPGAGARTLASLDLYQMSTVDSVHWTFGARSEVAFDMPFTVHGANPMQQVLFNFAVKGQFDVAPTHSYVADAGYQLRLSSLSVVMPDVYINAGFTLVNCINCGGLIGGGSEDVNGAFVTPWNGSDVDTTYSLGGVFPVGLANAGRLIINGYTGGGGHNSDLEIRLHSVTDGNGQALQFSLGAEGLHISAVPEPGAGALLAAGLLSLAWLRRRR